MLTPANTSNAVQIMFYANRIVSLALNGSSSAVTVIVVKMWKSVMITVISQFLEWLLTVILQLVMKSQAPIATRPFQITMNSSGSDNRIGYSTLAQDPYTRGRVNYRVRAEWIDTTGQRQLTYSNYVTINWVGGAATPLLHQAVQLRLLHQADQYAVL